MLNTNLDKTKKKEGKTQINLREHQIALKDRRNQFKDIKSILKTNVTLINESCRINYGVQKELEKHQSNNISKFYSKLSKDIDALTKRKESLQM